MSVKIWSHNPGSRGARELSAATGYRILKHEGSRWRPRPGDKVINWGSGERIPFDTPVYNQPQSVSQSSNKLRFFRATEGRARTPEWTNLQDIARGWAQNNVLIVARTVLNGHSGAGIVICGPNGVDIPAAPLYTRYVKKHSEYRVHLFRDQGVVDIQRKIKDPDFAGEPNFQIRNHDNGFIFVRNGVNDACPDDVLIQAQLAFEASGLDFGAVDVIWNDREAQAYVLEINTAPGLTGQTVETYTASFQRLLNQQ